MVKISRSLRDGEESRPEEVDAMMEALPGDPQQAGNIRKLLRFQFSSARSSELLTTIKFALQTTIDKVKWNQAMKTNLFLLWFVLRKGMSASRKSNARRSFQPERDDRLLDGLLLGAHPPSVPVC